MSYFELLEQFWQLDAERSIAPAASKLYFYLLNEFNAARPVHWPAKLYRRATQVYADLRIDKKTLPTAVAALEERGLIRHYSGDTSRSGEWHLNYNPAAEWAGGVGKNSPQQQPEPTEIGGKIPHAIPETAGDRGKNSPPIRNRQDKEKEKTTPLTSACVGEAAEETTPAPLPTEKTQLVPPVAEPPHAGQPGPVAAAELPGALAEEAKTLASTIGALWFITEQRNQPKWARIHTFCRRLALLGRLPEVQQQFAGYRLQREKAGLRPHQLDTWLGTPAADFADGEWIGCDWPAVAATTTTHPGQSAEATPPARATTSARKAQTSWS